MSRTPIVGRKCPTCNKVKADREFPRNAGGGRRRTCRACGPKAIPVAGWRAKEQATQALRRKAAALAELARRGISITPVATPAPEETHGERTATE